MVPEQSKTIVPPAATAVYRAAALQDVIRVSPVAAAVFPGPECSGSAPAAVAAVPNENARSAAVPTERARQQTSLLLTDPLRRELLPVVRDLSIVALFVPYRRATTRDLWRCSPSAAYRTSEEPQPIEDVPVQPTPVSNVRTT